MAKGPVFQGPAHRPELKFSTLNRDRVRRSKTHEQRVAGLLGGRRLPRSGGVAWSRYDSTTLGGDVSTDVLLIEHKRTECASLVVRREWLQKVRAGARRVLKDPAVVLTFETKGASPEDWILLPLEVYRRLVDEVGDDGDK